MKPTQAAREATGLNKVETYSDPSEDERLASQGTNAVKQPVQQPTRPNLPPTPAIVTAAEEARNSPRSAAETARGMRPPSAQGARSGPLRGMGGGAGGGSGFKTNVGTKGAQPMPSDFTLNVYAKGGQVGRVGNFGLKRSKPDFASGGDKTNFKMSTKKGKMPW